MNLEWIDSEEVEVHGPERYLSDVDGILVPGGFGYRGIEGKIESVRYAREKKIPYFGICLGMQCAVIEFARNVCGLKANSSEFDLNTQAPVIYLMEKWYDFRKEMEERTESTQKGGTMRLGAYPCVIEENTLACRHTAQKKYPNVTGTDMSSITPIGALSPDWHEDQRTSPDGELVEIIEIENHPWFLGCQFHPEFKSRPTEPHPLFRAFIEASLKEKRLCFPLLKADLKEKTGIDQRNPVLAAQPLEAIPFFIAGPCVIENEDITFHTAGKLKEICAG